MLKKTSNWRFFCGKIEEGIDKKKRSENGKNNY